MADEINVGKLVAEIILEAKTDGADEALDAINRVNNTAETINPEIKLSAKLEHEDDLIYIRDVLKTIGIQGEEADRILSSVFSDTSGLQQYKNNIEILASKIELQEGKVLELEAVMSKEPTFKSDYIEIDKATKSIDNERIALQELNAKFQKAYAAQDSWVVNQVKLFQRQEAATDSAAAKQEKLNRKMSEQQSKNNINTAVRTLVSSLRTADTVIPDVIDNMSDLITQISTIKEAMTSLKSTGAASTALSVASASVAGIGIAVSLITSFIQNMEQKKEKARKAALETLNAFSESEKNISDAISKYAEVNYKLNNLNLSRTEEVSLNQELLELQKQINEEYGKEAKNIDLVNGNVIEQIDNLKALRVEEAQKTAAETIEEYLTARDELSKNKNITIESLNYKENLGVTRGNKSAYKNIESALKQAGFSNERSNGLSKYWEIDIETGDAKEKLLELSSMVDSFLNGDISDGDREIYESFKRGIEYQINDLPDKLSDWTDTVKEYENAQEIIKNGGVNAEDVANVYKALFSTINENISAFGELQNAYTQLSSGQSLSADSLADLTEKYPDLQNYIIETGDLSLKNGEYLKMVAQDTMKSNIERIENEKAVLEEKGKLTDEEQGYYNQLSADAIIYQNQLDALNNTDLSEVKNSLSSLSSLSGAWKQLEDGKSLDFDTTLSLINQYPEFAQAMANGSLSIENQADVIKTLWEIKKQEAIASLQLERQKQIESEKTTSKVVGELQKQIDAYETDIQLRITMGAKESDYAATLQLINDLKEEQNSLTQADKDKAAAIDAQIAAIQGLTIETYNSVSATSNKNEALAEELKYMEHLKALGQLSAADELAWLERINASYAQSTDERYDMEVRLYNAQKALQEEQKKAIEDALNAEYKAISNNKSLDALSKQEELDWLLRIRDQYVLNAEQAIELQIKIHEAEKALRDEKLQNEYKAMENQKSLDRLTAEQELEWLERIQQTFEMNSDQRIELEIKIHNLKKQLADEEESALENAYDEALNRLERRKKLTALSYDLEIAYLEEIRRKYKLTAEDAADLEQRIRDLLSDKKEADISALDKLGDAVTEALQKKYEQQREMEEELINQSIENWQKWEDETVEAIQGQIDALDKLSEAQESEDKRRAYELKRQQIEMQIAYEKDDYNRKQLQKELNRLDKEEAKRLAEEERKAQKEALQAQIDEVKKKSEEQQDALQKELDAIGENYDELTSSFNLRAEAERTMMQSSQQQMVDLIKSYAPEYDLAGRSIGESLYQGFAGKYKSIETMVQQMANFSSHYQDMLADTANAATDDFWANRAEYEAELTAKANQSAQPAKQDISLVVNFYEPVESPIQVQRAMAEVVDNLAAEIKK